MRETSNDPPFGAVLRSLREQRGYTLEQAAAKARISPNYLGDVERGVRNPTLRVVARILTGLQTTWKEFGSLVDDGEPTVRYRRRRAAG